MATRFSFSSTGTPPVSPAFDAGWEQTGQAVRLPMPRSKSLDALTAMTNSASVTVPITTTQQILAYQFISDPLTPVQLAGTMSLVIRGLESNAAANVFLAFVLRAMSVDGGTVIGTLASSMTNAGTEFTTSAQTRIFSATALTSLAIPDIWRLVLEVGGHAQGPTSGQTYTYRTGTAGGGDFALTSALTTDLNPWLELSQDVGLVLNNYQAVRAGNGISVSERIR